MDVNAKGFTFFLTNTISCIFTASGNPDKMSSYVYIHILSCCRWDITVCFLEYELTRGDLLSYVGGDWTLPALPTEPLVGC